MVELIISTNLNGEEEATFTLSTGQTVTVPKIANVMLIPCPNFKDCHVLRFTHGDTIQNFNYTSIENMKSDIISFKTWRRS